MATQTGSIDLRGANSAKLYVDDEAGEIRSEVSETYATKTEVRRTDTGSGTVITSDDAANLPPLSLTIHGKSVQDGTPTPSSPVEIESVEGRNLSPYFSHDITDVYSASTNPNGYWFWFSTEATYTQKDDGWVHIAYSNTGSSAVYPNCIVQQLPDLKNGASYTFMVEIANATISGDVKFSPNGSAGSTVAYLNNVTAFSIANNSTYYKSTTAKSDFSGCNRFTRSYFNVPAGGSISLDLRISIYEGGYTGAYVPVGAIGLSLSDGTTAYIPLQGHALRSLPDGTEDVLDVDGEGNVTLTQRIGLTTTATTDGISATVGTDAMSTTGTLADGATVIYKLATPQTISLGKIDLPSLPSPSFSMHVDAAVTPTIDAEWWTQGGEEVGSVYQRTSALEQDVDGLTLELSEKVDSSEEWVSWLHAGTDATTHEPYLAMGKNSAYPSVVYGSDAARFYDGEGDAASNVVASFGTEGVVVGKDGSANTTISDSEIVFHDADGNEAGKISMSSEGAVPASAAYTLTTSGTATASDSITGITPLPDFTLGYLVLRNKVNSSGAGMSRFESWSDVASPVTMSTSTIDYTFKATPNGDTWGIEITATNRSGTTASQTVEYTLEWYYSGSAPQYKFGTGENAGAYSFLAGLGLETAKPAQVVLGSYNEPSQTDLFIVGDGTSDGNRSNALWIDENRVLHIVSFSQYAGGVELTQSALWSWQQALFGYSDSEDWTYLAGSASGNFCRWRIASGWMQVEIYYTSGAGLTANTAKHYGAIPGNFAPDHEVNNALYLGANKNGQANMWVTSGGAVWVNSTIASSTVYGQLQYPIQRPL